MLSTAQGHPRTSTKTNKSKQHVSLKMTATFDEVRIDSFLISSPQATVRFTVILAKHKSSNHRLKHSQSLFISYTTLYFKRIVRAGRRVAEGAGREDSVVVNEAAGRQRPERQNFWQQVRHCTASTLTTPGLTKEKLLLLLFKEKL